MRISDWSFDVCSSDLMDVSLGVVECLSALLPTPQVSSPSSPMKSPERDLGRIKWPNDIFFGQRKLGGILIENMLAGAILKTSVVGIGLNVNQEQFRGLKQATSLKLETGRDFLLKPLLAGIFHSLEARYLQLRGGARRSEEHTSNSSH